MSYYFYLQCVNTNPISLQPSAITTLHRRLQLIRPPFSSASRQSVLLASPLPCQFIVPVYQKNAVKSALFGTKDYATALIHVRTNGICRQESTLNRQRKGYSISQRFYWTHSCDAPWVCKDLFKNSSALLNCEPWFAKVRSLIPMSEGSNWSQRVHSPFH